ncbi:MAG: hypothetical protein GYB36_07525 [Alphaproteobacteria bacterium]|nr:hypothetical protein [Alphaproteobacteria bacterium]
MVGDPIGYADQWNLYAYVGNSPLMYNDPTGEAGNFVGGFGYMTRLDDGE